MYVKRIVIALIVVAGCLGFLLVGCHLSQSPVPYDWSTDNETVPPGDWDGILLFQDVGPSTVSRVAVPHTGSYSYEHYSDCAHSTCWASTYITCSVPVTEGHYTAWIRFDSTLPGIGVLEYPVGTVGELSSTGDGNITAPADIEAWMLQYDAPSGKMAVECWACNPNQEWLMSFPITETWQEYTIEWNLPCGSSDAYIRAWMDGILYVDANVSTDACTIAYPDLTFAAAGIKDWHYWWGGNRTIWVDDVVIYPCDEPAPTPTPTIAPADKCKQYGRAAVLNIDGDCEAVLRINNVASQIPGDAIVTRAKLYIYGMASEVPGETVYVTELNALWGEMTTDWCRRTVGNVWGEAGAYNVPLDREPGSIANFETALGWIEIDLPTALIEDWAHTGEANPGLIFWNPALTGKFSVASREWYTEDYRPYLRVWYTD